MNTRTFMCGAGLLALGLNAPVWAQSAPIDAHDDANADLANGEFLVIGSRAEDVLLTDRFTGSITVLSSDKIAQRQTRNIEDVLRDVPGVAIGSIAGQTQIRIRGTEGNHVLVLVDGIEVSDPGTGEFDVGTLQAEIGSRVDILRGPQSALYGNDAIGGVIAYDSGTFDGFEALIEGGSNATINGAARWGIDRGKLAGSLSAVVVSTDGEPNARGGVRDIGRDSYTLSGKLAIDATATLRLRAIARYVQTEGDFNEQDFGFLSPTVGLVIDSPGTRFDNESFSALLGARLDTLQGSWVHDLSVQINDANRQTTQPTGFPSSTESDRFKASYVSTFDFGTSDHSLTFAADYELEGFNNVQTFDFRNEVENVGFVAEYLYSGGAFDLAAAIRHDINDLFQDATTFRVGAGYRATDTTRLRAAIGSGVKNPTLNELFGFFDGRFVGNPNLQPEELIGWEIGIDQTLANGSVMLSATYFDAELESEIFTTFPPPTFVATPGNRTTQSSQKGFEIAAAVRLGPQWSLDANYTYLDAEENGATEVRRPESTASAALTWTAPGDAASATLVVRHNGEMLDNDFTTGAFPAPVTTLDDFTLVNLNARVRLTDAIELFGRVENLLDEQYEQVFSFVSPGRTAIAGVRVQL